MWLQMLEDKNIVIRNQSKSFDLATQYYKACLMKFSDTKSGPEKYPAFQKVMSVSRFGPLEFCIF